MAQHDVTIFNVSADEPGGSDVQVQLAGAAINGLGSAVSTPQESNSVSLTLSGAESTGDAGTLAAFGQGTPGTLGYPRVMWTMVGNIGAWASDEALGEDMRAGIALGDAVVLNMNPAIITDQLQANGTMSRQAIVNDLKARNPDILIFDYTNVMEKSNRADSGSAGLKCYQGEGPAGAEVNWTAKDYGELQNRTTTPGGTDLIYYPFVGYQVADWWARTADGTKKATFTSTNSPYNVNICPAYTQPDANGWRFPQYFFNVHEKPDRLDPHETSNGGSGIGVDGINIYIDVHRVNPKSSRIDFNGDGSNDSADDLYDAHDPDNHTAAQTLAGGGLAAAAQWRIGQRDYFNLFKATYNDIIVIGNLTSWFPDTVDDEGALGYDVQPEYQITPGTSIPLTNDYPRQSHVQGGIVENVVGKVDDGASITGVNSDGTVRSASTVGWQRAYNKYRYLMEICADPKIVFVQYYIRASDRLGQAANGRYAWAYEPHASTPFHLHRWCLGIALMEDGYVSPAATEYDTNVGTFVTPMVFDEYGTINTATTGLSRGWLGQPLEDATVISGSGDHRILRRYFENGVALVNTSKTNNIAFSSSDIGGANVFKRINGVQDPTWNDGTNVVGGFVIPSIDGIVLERI